MTIREAYAILSLDATASTPEMVRAAYRTAILRHHPDTVYGTTRESSANEKTVQLNLAYEYLANLRFPRYETEPRIARDVRSNQSPSWSPQEDDFDADFEQWRESVLKNPRKLFAYHVKEMGVVRTTWTWITIVVQSSMLVLLGIAGLASFKAGWILGLTLTLVGFGGALVSLRRLQGRT